MSFGFFVILTTQFLTALADNGLVFAAIALLKNLGAPAWQVPVLQQGFVLAFILLAPYVGHLADALPKPRVMFLGNAVKVLGCVAMLSGIQPLLAYACVGVGGAMYSPAKYGILSEFFPVERLVWANGWMEGVTVAAIIFGALAGGFLVGERSEQLILLWLEGFRFHAGIRSAAQFAIAVLLTCYTLAALAALQIPRRPIDRRFAGWNATSLMQEFYRSLLRLWNDPPGRLAVMVTSLVWGVGTTLRFVILAWSAAALHFDLEKGAELTALVVIGVGIGAGWAGAKVHLAHATRVLRVGVVMGLAVVSMAFVTDWRVALPLLVFIGFTGGYLLVPMNALLQHRGYLLVGAGHSIALQNVGENISILSMLSAYALLLKLDVSVNATIILLGTFIAAVTAGFGNRHRRPRCAAGL